MNALTFNEKEFSKSDVRDLMKFMSMIQSDTRFRNNGRLFVNRFNESDDDKIKILTLRKSGLTYPKIAEQFNVSQQRIALICKQYEIEMYDFELPGKPIGRRIIKPKLDSEGCLILKKI